MVCIIGVGLLLSVRTGFLQLRKFPYAIKTTIGRIFRKKDASDGAMTPFQAVCTALAATVGTGNIAGVAGAIAIGGPGAVRRVFDERVSFLVTDMLKDNAARADAFGLNSPLQVPFEMAAKTGTSKDYRDNFAVGYTPRWTVAVWAGNFDGSPMRRVSGIAGAAPILHDLAVYMQSVYPSPRFTLPDGVKAVTVCAQSGLPAGKNCKHVDNMVIQ